MAWGTIVNIPLIFIGNCCGPDRWDFGFVPGSFGPYEFTREDAIVASAPAPGLAASLTGALALFALRRRRTD